MKYIALAASQEWDEARAIPPFSQFLYIFLGNLLPGTCQIHLFLSHRSSFETCPQYMSENACSMNKWSEPSKMSGAHLYAQVPCSLPKGSPVRTPEGARTFLLTKLEGRRVEKEGKQTGHTQEQQHRRPREKPASRETTGLCVLGYVCLWVRGAQGLWGCRQEDIHLLNKVK